MKPSSLLVRDALVFNAYLKRFRRANVWITEGKFAYIDPACEDAPADAVIDAGGRYMIPGLIDIHMHIESSMLTPLAYSRCAARDGVTTIVSEPHEIANVKGLRGIDAMIRASQAAPIDIFFGIPSSVPSTNAGLETTGGVIDAADMRRLLDNQRVVCVGEVMNYRQVIRENDLEITKFLQYLREARPGFVTEGHCPALLGRDLAKFLYLGIDADHTEHSLEEFRQRIENGMFMELQSKMILPEIIQYIRDEDLFEHCGFVTDDTMADRLVEQGGVNAVVDKAVRAGFPLEQAVYCATYTNARRMHLYDRGAIAPGKIADFLLLSTMDGFHPDEVYKQGSLIYRKGAAEAATPAPGQDFPEDFYHSVHITAPAPQLFRIPAPAGASQVEVRTMEVSPHLTKTKERRVRMPVENGEVNWQASGCALAAVLERHGKSGTLALGLVSGSGLHSGAVATTYFHDHHNLFVLGCSPEDMAAAAARLLHLQGGILAVRDGAVLAEVPLPICGLLSEESAAVVGAQLHGVRTAIAELGYRHDNPIMSLCTLGLPVSPALKLTDKGLVKVDTGEIVPLIVEAEA